jgi:hypothetical protein
MVPMKRLLVVCLLASLLMPTIAVAFSPETPPPEPGADPRVGEPWWDYGWNFRRSITMDNTGNAEALANYQVLLNVSYDSDMRSDFSDLRFTQFNQTLGQNEVLPYYIEQKSDGSFATVWVKAGRIAASASSTMHMYYGNPSAIPNSSATGTFEFFDDFATDPSARWTTVKGSVAWDSSNGWFSYTTTGGTNGNDPLMTIASAMTPIKNVELVMKVNMDSAASLHDAGPLGRMVDNNNGYGIVLQADNYFSIRIQNAGVSTHLGYLVRPVAKQNWYWIKMQLFGTTIRGRYWAVGTAEPNSWDHSVQDGNYTGNGRIGIQQIRGGPSRFDDVRARKFTNPEPSCTVGAEELPFKFKSFTYSPPSMNDGDTVFLNATFNNPTPEMIKLSVSARDADTFNATTDYFYTEDVNLAPSSDTTLPFTWTAKGGPHTIWMAVFGYPVGSVKIKVNRNPVLVPIKDQTLWQGVEFDLQLNASDPDGDPLTWSIDNSFLNLTPLNNRSAQISCLPTNDDIGIHRANITVRDPMNRTASIRMNFTVNNVNDPPVLTMIPSLTATQYKELRYQAKATDPDIKWGDVLTFSDNTDLFDIDEKTGVFFFTPAEELVGKHNVKVTVTDMEGASETSSFAITVANVNDPPTLEILPPQFTIQGRLFQLKVVAADPDLKSDPTEKLRYSDDSALFNINNDTGMISFTPSNDDLGIHLANITVTDRGGLSNTTLLTINVMNVNDPPTMDAIPAQTATEEQPFQYQCVATDPDLKWGLDNLTFSDDTDLFNIDPGTGAIVFTPTGAQTGSRRITITVKDERGGQASSSFDLSVIHINHPPFDVAIRFPVDGARLKEGDQMWLDGTARDSDKGDTLRYSWLDNGNPIGTGKNISVNLKSGKHTIKLEVSDGTETVSSEVSVEVAKKEAITVAGGGDWTMLVGAAVAVMAVLGIVGVLAARRRRKPQEQDISDDARVSSVPDEETVALPPVPPAEAAGHEEGAGEETEKMLDSALDRLADYQEAHPEESLDMAPVMESIDTARGFLKSGEYDDARAFAMEVDAAVNRMTRPAAPKRVAVKKKKAVAAKKSCPGCGEQLEAGWPVCPACGHKMG